MYYAKVYHIIMQVQYLYFIYTLIGNKFWLLDYNTHLTPRHIRGLNTIFIKNNINNTLLLSYDLCQQQNKSYCDKNNIEGLTVCLLITIFPVTVVF